MKSRDLVIRNAAIDLSDRQTSRTIVIGGGAIREIGTDIAVEPNMPALDARGRHVVPGFIDVHIQGAGGADVLDGTPEALEAISRTCARFGVTGFLATTVFHTEGDNAHLVAAARAVDQDLGGARLLGIHLEGPFISLQKRGMIQPRNIRPPSPRVLEKIFELTESVPLMMTIAPELDGALDLVERLSANGAIASIGHTMATYDQARAGIDAGISHVTHLFNAMPSLHHRAPGPLTACAEARHVSAQIIPDGVHVHPSVVRLAYELFGPDRLVTITDGMQAVGLPEGRYTYNGIEYESRSGTARYDNGTLIGTALGLNELGGRLNTFTGCGLAAALDTLTTVPARVLGSEAAGSVPVEGAPGDLAIVDNDLTVWATVVDGAVVYRKDHK